MRLSSIAAFTALASVAADPVDRIPFRRYIIGIGLDRDKELVTEAAANGDVVVTDPSLESQYVDLSGIECVDTIIEPQSVARQLECYDIFGYVVFALDHEDGLIGRGMKFGHCNGRR